MKRLIVTLGLIAAAAVSLVTVAGASDTRTYQVELFNAFGLVNGSELRVAGAKAGTITDLEITPQKTALVTVEEDSSFPEFKADASCSSEPQSLIAEYFLNCQPGTSTQPLTRTDPGGTQQDDGPARSRAEHAACAVPRPPPASDQRVRNRARQQRREPERGDPGRRPRAPAAQAGPQHPRQPEPDDRRAQHERGRDLRPAREPPRGRRPLHRQRGPYSGDLGRALERPGAELPPARRLPGRAAGRRCSSSDSWPMPRRR